MGKQLQWSQDYEVNIVAKVLDVKLHEFQTKHQIV